MRNALITDTASKLGISVERLLKRVAESKGFSNADDVAANWYRNHTFNRVIEDYCLDQFRKEEHVQPHAYASSQRPAIS